MWHIPTRVTQSRSAGGATQDAILEEMEAHGGRPSEVHPYGTGDAARKTVDVIEEFLVGKALP